VQKHLDVGLIRKPLVLRQVPGGLVIGHRQPHGDGLQGHRPPRFVRLDTPKTEHPLFAFVTLNVGFQDFDPDCFFSFLGSDAVPCDVLSVLGVPLERNALQATY